MKKADVFPSKYLKSDDLNGKPITVTIERAPLEPLKSPEGKEQNKTVLYFRGAKKALPLNLRIGMPAPRFAAKTLRTGRDTKSSSTRPRHRWVEKRSTAFVSAHQRNVSCRNKTRQWRSHRQLTTRMM